MHSNKSRNFGLSTWRAVIVAALATVSIAACGGGGDSGSGSSAGSGGTVTPAYTVGGSTSGLTGTGLVLQNNAGDSLTIHASGSFTFATSLATGGAYAVSVQTQPSNPAQTCTVASGTGTVASANVTNVAVTCVTNSYSVGAAVSGLAGSGLVLQTNGGNNVSVTSAGNVTLANLPSATAYTVTVLTQPTSPSQTCAVANGTGTVTTANITNVAITCTTNSYNVGGSVSGLAGSGLVLQTNGGHNLSVSASGSYTFASLPSGTAYTVTVLTQPSTPTQACVITNGTGTVGGTNVASVVATCTTSTYTVGGSVTGLTGSGLVLQDNAGDNLTVPASSTSFTFATHVASGQAYAVTVLTQPSTPAQRCTVSSGSGTIINANIATVALSCVTTGQYVYVSTTQGSVKGVISLFTIDPATGALSSSQNVAVSPVHPLGMALDTGGQYAYVAYQDSNSLATESITAGTGQFSETGYASTGFGAPYSIAVDPVAPYLYSGGLSGGSGNLFAYSISAGVLTPLSASPYSAGYKIYGLAVDALGKFLYAPSNDGLLYGFSIASNGSLNPLSGSPFTFQSGAPTNRPYAIAIHPAGGYLYLTDSVADTVTAYAYDSVTGAVTLVGSPQAVGTTPESAAIDPSGRFLYVANAGDATVSAFAIDGSTGALTAISGSPFSTGSTSSVSPSAIQVEASGQFAYVANGDAATISAFTIDATTGALAPIGSPQSTVGGLGGSGGASSLVIK